MSIVTRPRLTADELFVETKKHLNLSLQHQDMARETCKRLFPEGSAVTYKARSRYHHGTVEFVKVFFISLRVMIRRDEDGKRVAIPWERVCRAEQGGAA
jgi:hypothetical protein